MTHRSTVVGAAALGASLLVALPVNAAAHDTSRSLYNSSGNRYGYGGVVNSHQNIYSCDTAPDGYGFRAEYQLINGTRGYVDDANGSSAGCSEISPGTRAFYITRFRVVSKHGSNTANWVYGAWATA